jgi:two-component system, cell cycle response regulator DivK
VKRILIIEDVELNRDLLIQLLEDTYTLLEATDGKAGLDTAYRERPDLILLDLSLPVIDGWEVARQLKASAVTATIPVIALTAHAMSGDERRAKECGCDGYITKPIDDVVLLDRIAALIGEHR